MEMLESNGADNQPNTFALRGPKAIHLFPGEHEEILERLSINQSKTICIAPSTNSGRRRLTIEES